MKKALLPLGILGVLVVFLALGLQRDPKEIPSPLVGKAAPLFEAPQLPPSSRPTFSPKDMAGQVWLLNVWASWCVACRIEHPVLMDLARRNIAPIVGLDYKDQVANGQRWLQQHGNPYLLSVVDADGRIGIDYGVYGVPETFVIDKTGVIRHKVIGPVTQDMVDDKLIPLIRSLQK